MILNKKFLAGTAITFVTLLVACSPKDEVILSIGDYELSKDEFYVMLRDEEYVDGLTFGDIIMEQHILMHILEDKYGDKVTQEYVDGELDKVVQSQGGEEAFEEMLETEGTEKDKVLSDIRTQGLLLEAYKEYFPIDKEDIKDDYEQMVPVGRRIAHILVPDTAIADEVMKKIEAGDEFADLVAEYSMDEGSLESNGEYTLMRNYFVPEFEEAALALSVEGELSEYVVSDYGVHIIKLVNVGEKGTYEEEEERLENIRYQETMYQDQNAYSEIMSNLLSEYEPEITITDDALEDLVTRILKNIDDIKKEAEEQEALMEMNTDDLSESEYMDGDIQVTESEEVIEEPQEDNE